MIQRTFRRTAQRISRYRDAFTDRYWQPDGPTWRATRSPTLRHHGHEVLMPSKELNLLSYNIQAGIGTASYRHYVTKSWRHVIPARQSKRLLDNIGDVIRDYDVAMLQEVDGGSLRSGFVDQLAYLAARGDFDYWHRQVNRNFGKLGQFSNGFLSRFKPYSVENHSLPGLPGRGAIVIRYGKPECPLIFVGVHLSLSERARFHQFDYIKSLIDGHEHVIVMGDMNCEADLLLDTPLRDTPLRHVSANLKTFPSWAPVRSLDHILVTPSLRVTDVTVLDCGFSDHLPLSVRLSLPEQLISVPE